MTQTSVHGFVAFVHGDDHLGADCGVDTSYVQTLVNNLQHLHDVYPQYRVNWSAPTAAQGGFYHPALAGGKNPIWVHRFPITKRYTGHPVALDVRVAIKVEATGDVGVVVRVVQDWVQFPAPGSTAVPGVLAVMSESTGSLTAVWVIDEVLSLSPFAPTLRPPLVMTVDDDGTPSTSLHEMVRLEIEVVPVGVDEADLINLVAVQVREVLG